MLAVFHYQQIGFNINVTNNQESKGPYLKCLLHSVVLLCLTTGDSSLFKILPHVSCELLLLCTSIRLQSLYAGSCFPFPDFLQTSSRGHPFGLNFCVLLLSTFESI